MQIACSTEFFWGVGISAAASALRSMGVRSIGLFLDLEYLPRRISRRELLSLRSLGRGSVDFIVIAPERDVNASSTNDYIANASIRCIIDSIDVAKSLGSKLCVVDLGYPTLDLESFRVRFRRALREILSVEYRQVCIKLSQPDLQANLISSDIPVAVYLEDLKFLDRMRVEVIIVEVPFDDRGAKLLRELRGFGGYLLLRPAELKYSEGLLRKYLLYLRELLTGLEL